ncbi:hypothetical protein ACEW7V_03505, partial [Areca yellow leaf disease phytoplasma]|uniref:hypothetical protein n=1 Tax=Areca yellow leaf disease phytoplasma TaxID=927614 RepID=UPI0035B51BEC
MKSEADKLKCKWNGSNQGQIKQAILPDKTFAQFCLYQILFVFLLFLTSCTLDVKFSSGTILLEQL